MNTELLLAYLAATHNLDKLMDEAEAWQAELIETRDETPEDWRDSKHDRGGK